MSTNRRIIRWFRRFLGTQLQEIISEPNQTNILSIRLFYQRAFQALQFNGIDGDYVEFGVARGGSLREAFKIARKMNYEGAFWAFDSFRGLPPRSSFADQHPRFKENEFAYSLQELELHLNSAGIELSDIRVVPGLFEDTLSDPEAELPTNINLAYIDCDYYSSTRTVLNFLLPRIKHGMIIAFDDYHCWSKNQPSGNRRAQLEIFNQASRWRLLPYMQIGFHGMSFVVENKSLHDSLGPEKDIPN